MTRVESRTRLKNTSSWDFTKQEWRSASFWQKQIKPKYEKEEENDPMSSGDFTLEDIFACEQQQKAFASPFFEVGPAAVGESTVLDHQNVVLSYLEGKWQKAVTQAPSAKQEEEKTESNHCVEIDSEVQITFKGETQMVQLKGGEIILEAALNEGIKPPYACQAGVCGACKATLLSGTCKQNLLQLLVKKR